MAMSTRRLLLGGLAVLLGQAVLACPAQAQDKKEITLGYSISLTGKFSTDATDTHRGYQLWAEQTNKAGGISIKGRKIPVKLIHYDDTSDTNSAIRSYERLITRDEVDLLLSPWGSGHNFAVTAATEKYKIPMVLSSAASDRIFERNLKYIFGSTQLASNFYESLGDYLATVKDQVKTVAIAYENFLFTQSLHDFLLKKLEKVGVKVVVDEQYPLGGQDFTSLLTKVKAANPDAFIVIDIMPSAVYMTRQMNEVGLRPKLYAVNIGPMFTQEFTATLGKSAENVVENGFWHPDLPYKGAKQYFADYVAQYKKEPVDRRGLCVHRDHDPAAGDREGRKPRSRADHAGAANHQVRHHPRALRIRRSRRQQGSAQLPGSGPERPAHHRLAERGRPERLEAAVLTEPRQTIGSGWRAPDGRCAAARRGRSASQ